MLLPFGDMVLFVVSDMWPILLPLGAMIWSVVSDMWPMLPPLGTMFGMWFLICGLCRYLLVQSVALWFLICGLCCYLLVLWFGNDVWPVSLPLGAMG